MRAATVLDIPAIVSMGRAFHASAGLPGDFISEDFAATARRMIESDDAVILMCGRGMIGAVLQGLFYSEQTAVASEIFWWSEDGHGAALLSAFEEWARFKGAALAVMSSIDAERGNAVKKYLGRRGYAAFERNYRKAI